MTICFGRFDSEISDLKKNPYYCSSNNDHLKRRGASERGQVRKRAFEWFPCNSNAFQKDAVACLHNAFQTKQLK